MTDKPPFPFVVDSTLISTLRSCQTKAKWMYLDHWKPQRESVHLVAGKAFAAGLETARNLFYRDGKPAAEAICAGLTALTKEYGAFESPPESAKSWVRMAGALEYYFEVFPLGADRATPHFFGDRHGIEFSFAVPLPVLHPVTGDPLIFAGRADMIADSFGGLMIYDEKTTSSLGPTWGNQWEMRSQFTAYTWAALQHGVKPTGVVVRGISILKNSYDNKQHITYRADWERERWLRQTCRDLERFKAAWLADDFEYNLDHSCAEYSGCVFTRPCKSKDPQPWLEQEFTRRVWDPLHREEKPIESSSSLPFSG